MVRHGLRPPHYLLEVGCGALTTGQHVARYLLTGRYYCIESDEFLLRAAVEYEVPAAGLIYKRPRFMSEFGLQSWPSALTLQAVLARRPSPHRSTASAPRLARSG